jgi:hypothetical protein
VAEVLHLEEAGRAVGRNPWPVATPGATGSEMLELLVKSFETVPRQTVNAVVEYPGHG